MAAVRYVIRIAFWTCWVVDHTEATKGERVVQYDWNEVVYGIRFHDY